MNEAIKLAIEKGGYDRMWEGTHSNHADLILDPLFWKALGKALGWKEHEFWKIHCSIFECDGTWQHTEKDLTWKYYAHQYFDLLLTGKDTDKFWPLS